ncbi:MAG: hypothetical protein V7765_10325 [Oleispira sp.]
MQILNIKKALAIIIVGIIGLSGCAKENSSKKDVEPTSLSSATDLLSEQNWSGAIEILGDLYTADPKSPEVQIALGRAYAGQAGISQEQLMTSLKTSDEDGNEITELSSATVNSFVNYYNESQYRSRIANGRQAIFLLMPEDGDISEMTDEDKVELGLAAAAQSILLLGNVIKDTSLASKSKEDIGQLVEASFDDIKEELEQLATVVSETQSEIAGSLADGVTSKIAATMVLDDFFSENGFNDGEISSTEVTELLFKLVPAS